MAKVKITGHASGTGILTVTAPNTSTDRTITLPDATGTLLNSDGDGSSLTGVITDLTAVRRDIATLALHSAIADNKAAYNLPNSFIDQFEDDTGIGTETTVDRDTSSEFVASTVTGSGIDSYTKCLLHMEDTGLTDSIGTHTVTRSGVDRSSTQAKFGTYSAEFGVNDYLSMPDHADWDIGTGDYTIDAWVFQKTATDGSWHLFAQSIGGSPAANNQWFLAPNSSSTGAWLGTHPGAGTVAEIGATIEWSETDNEWYHIAVVKTGTSIKIFINGTLATTGGTTTNAAFSNFNGSSREMWIGTTPSSPDGEDNFQGYIDEMRFSKGIARWTSNFTPPTAAYAADSISATGTLISAAQTANAAQTKVSGVILYKNEDGTATLGTDLKVYFTCNGGTNWTESTPTAAGTFSTGILMAKCPEVTCTSGTDVRYKVVWANQASGSKETQLHGVGMNY